METFQIKEDFYLNGKPFKILSGAIHYFRVPPDDWYHSLYNLKALGFNTVETYVPWNLHEYRQGQFDFSGQLDLPAFLDLAQELGLYAIVRPTPYICAEWEFGGLPAWLLNQEGMGIRRLDSRFLEAVSSYYDVLLPKLASRQVSQGGNILMFQIENEYGSYGQEKGYLRAIKALMDKYLDMPFFTSDGPWLATLRAGSLIEEDILVTGNFGSKADFNFDNLQAFFDEHGKKWPLMCMEFWDGWFNRWNEPVIRRDPQELAQAVQECLKRGSINLYMFHGGTNFGFMNGCSARGRYDLPQVTSYDYDAILDEAGNPTRKFFALQDMLKANYPKLDFREPLYKQSFKGTAQLQDRVSLFETLDTVASFSHSVYPKTMEEVGQNLGYILYQTRVKRDSREADYEERFRVIDASDRIQVYLNGLQVACQDQYSVGEDIRVPLVQEDNQLAILVENTGRVNYGHKLLAETQRKGIRTGVCSDLHFLTDFDQYSLEWLEAPEPDFSRPYREGQPAFYRYTLEVTKTGLDTYLDMTAFGKGIVFVNGHHLGRYYQLGPITSLYLPHSFLKMGTNDILVFDTEGQVVPEQLNLVEKPVYISLDGK